MSDYTQLLICLIKEQMNEIDDLNARIADMEQQIENDHQLILQYKEKVAELNHENAKLREHMAALRERYPNSPWIYEWATAALEATK